MKLSRKLIPAFAMLLISAIMMTTASYAWFSINSDVDVNGMTVSTTTSDSILVATDVITSTGPVSDAAFGTTLTQGTAGGTLNPVSTVDGVNFYYVDGGNVTGSGDAKEEEYIAYNHSNTAAFNTAYGTTGQNAVGYVEYVFQIKATNADPSNAKSLNITTLGLAYSGAVDNDQKAFRVAVFADTNEDGFTSGVGTHITTLRADDATYLTTDKAVASDSGLDTVAKLDTAATLASVGANKTEYVKVVVRLWLEGEDTTCKNNVYADLVDGTFALNLKVQFGGDAVTALTLSKADS